MPLRHSSKHAPSGMNTSASFRSILRRLSCEASGLSFDITTAALSVPVPIAVMPLLSAMSMSSGTRVMSIVETTSTRFLSRFEKYEPPSPSVAETNTNGMSSTLERKSVK